MPCPWVRAPDDGKAAEANDYPGRAQCHADKGRSETQRQAEETQGHNMLSFVSSRAGPVSPPGVYAVIRQISADRTVLPTISQITGWKGNRSKTEALPHFCTYMACRDRQQATKKRMPALVRWARPDFSASTVPFKQAVEQRYGFDPVSPAEVPRKRGYPCRIAGLRRRREPRIEKVPPDHINEGDH